MAREQQGTCEVFIGARVAPGEAQCKKPATMRYPAMGGGHMRLCSTHGAKHAAYCERWNGAKWGPAETTSPDTDACSHDDKWVQETELNGTQYRCRLCGRVRWEKADTPLPEVS